jgi:hypothetical protein
MSLQAAVKGRASQVRDHVLQRDKDVIERQPGLNPERHDRPPLHGRQHIAAPFLQPHRQILDRLPTADCAT